MKQLGKICKRIKPFLRHQLSIWYTVPGDSSSSSSKQIISQQSLQHIYQSSPAKWNPNYNWNTKGKHKMKMNNKAQNTDTFNTQIFWNCHDQLFILSFHFLHYHLVFICMIEVNFSMTKVEYFTTACWTPCKFDNSQNYSPKMDSPAYCSSYIKSVNKCSDKHKMALP